MKSAMIMIGDVVTCATVSMRVVVESVDLHKDEVRGRLINNIFSSIKIAADDIGEVYRPEQEAMGMAPRFSLIGWE